MKTNTIIINMGGSYTPRKKSKKYNWKKHLKASPKYDFKLGTNKWAGECKFDFSKNSGPWVVLDYHSRDNDNNTVYIDKYGTVHNHASLQRLTDKGYRLHFK